MNRQTLRDRDRIRANQLCVNWPQFTPDFIGAAVDSPIFFVGKKKKSLQMFSTIPTWHRYTWTVFLWKKRKCVFTSPKTPSLTSDTCTSLLLSWSISDFRATLSYISMPQRECILELRVNAPKPISGAFTQTSDGARLESCGRALYVTKWWRLLMFPRERPVSQPAGRPLLSTCQIKTLSVQCMATWST